MEKRRKGKMLRKNPLPTIREENESDDES